MKRFKFHATFAVLLILVLQSQAAIAPLANSQNVAQQQARVAHDWVRDGVIYEVYPRAFSKEGDFNGVTAQLDRLKELGVTIIWLMPIHPIGQEKKKGTIGSPYAVRDYYGITPPRDEGDYRHRGESHVVGQCVNETSGILQT